MTESVMLLAPRQTTLRLSQPLRRLSILVAVLILFTSSFDIFLILNAGGNYRFCQIVSPPLIALAVLKAKRGRSIPFIGSRAICIWLLFQLAFVPVTDFWPKSLGYCFWLVLNLGLMFSFVQLFSGDPRTLKTILRWYLYSFGFIAAFGIVQFVLPVAGLPGVLIRQWWIPDNLPRINGFSYEPSYFASYLLIGLVFVGSLRRARSTLLPPKMLLCIYCLTAIGIVISSSRMGIVFLLADVLLAQAKPWLSFLEDFRRLRIVPAKVRALLPTLLSFASVLTLIGGAVILLENNPALTLLFLNGTGISDTAAHSVIQREDALEETVSVFLEHPWIGRSLGGVSSAIANREGETIQSFEDSKNFEGMNVFAEILAASGIIGLIPFLYFLVATIWWPLKLARIALPFYSSLLRALVRSLVFAWAILQFNQNVLRPYLWVHLAILATVYAAALRVIKTPGHSCPVSK